MKKNLALLLALLMALSCLAGCGQTETPAASSAPAEVEAPPAIAENAGDVGTVDATVTYKDTVYTTYVADLDSPDPYGSTSAQHQIYTNLTFDCLAINDPDTGKLNPQLATAWEDVDGDGKNWKISLVENAISHDGKPLTADDVKFTWEYAAAGAGNVIKPISAMDYVESIEVFDEHTVLFHLKNGMFDFPTYLEQPIYSKEAFDTMDPVEAGAIGFGPYYYDKALQKNGVEFTATRFDEYWGGIENYPTKHITFKVLSGDGTNIAALEAGEIDFAFYNLASSYNILDADEGIEMLTRTGANSWYLGFNYKGGAADWNDLELRQAVCKAIDKSAIVAVAWNTVGGVESYNFCSPNGLGYKEVDPIKADTNAAAAYFAEKYPNGITITLAHYPSGKGVAEVVQACLMALGVDCQLKQVDGTNWTAFKSEGKDYDIFVDYCAYQGALLYNFNRFFYSNGSSNVYGYYNADYEALQDKVSGAPSYEDMLKEFGVLQQWVAENVPIFPLGYVNCIAAYRTGVEGLVLAPTNNYMNFRTVRIPE